MSNRSPPPGIRDHCDTPAGDDNGNRDTSWDGWVSIGMEKINTIIDHVLPPGYSNMARDAARDRVAPAFQTAYKVCLSASAKVATAAKMALVAVMGWMRTVVCPWACAAAKDAVNTVTTNAVPLLHTAFRSSSAGLSAALQFVRDLSGPAPAGATGVTTATAASPQESVVAVLGAAAGDFWSSPAGRVATAKVTALLGEGGTAVLDAAGEFWACPAMEAARETVVPLVEKGAATVVEAISHPWTSAAVEGGQRLVKTHLLDNELVSRPNRFALSFIHSLIPLACYTNRFVTTNQYVTHLRSTCIHRHT